MVLSIGATGSVKYKFLPAAQRDPLCRIQQLLPQKRLLGTKKIVATTKPAFDEPHCHKATPIRTLRVNVWGKINNNTLRK